MTTPAAPLSSSSANSENGANSRPVRYEDGWDLFRKMGSPKWVVAPMVEQSELPFRALCRKYGCTLAYTPMYHAASFAQSEKYRSEFTTCAEDRPLVVQFCANDPDVLLRAARHVEDRCDAVDINLGCPQRIAKRGHYGAYLLEDLPKVLPMVRALHQNLSIPVTCKIRRLPSDEATLDLARAIQDAGCAILTVHGRTKEQNKQLVGECDFDIIKRIKEELQIPVFANGGVETLEDAQRIMEYTGVDAVMSAEGLLSDPALFSGLRIPELQLAREYLAITQQYPVSVGPVRAHMFKLLHRQLRIHTHARDLLARCLLQEVPTVIAMIEEGEAQSSCSPDEMYEEHRWYQRHMGFAKGSQNNSKNGRDGNASAEAAETAKDSSATTENTEKMKKTKKKKKQKSKDEKANKNGDDDDDDDDLGFMV